jgi:hypothetical protein
MVRGAADTVARAGSGLFDRLSNRGGGGRDGGSSN